MTTVFDSVRLGRYSLPNRLVMAPMTRSRAQFDGTPGELAATYYAQRASVGLIVSEGTQPFDGGQSCGVPNTRANQSSEATPLAWTCASSPTPKMKSLLSVRRSTARSMKRRTLAGCAMRLP